MSNEKPKEAIKRLQVELRNARQMITALNAGHAAELDSWKTVVWGEQQMRRAAQRGLVPYVKGLQALDGWLRERPELREVLRPILQEQGLWEIRLGYDPEQDLALTAISPRGK